jgi:crotonobetainyl-CoA:carnitine CoA-transferase CaiB-like acyl-CoA transferase
MVAAGNDNLFRRLCTAIGRPNLAEDPRFRTNGDRVVNRRALIPILADCFAGELIAAWAARLDAAGIPNGPIQTVDHVVADEQTAALGMIQRWMRSGEGRGVSLVGLPLSFDGARPPFAKLAPGLGEDNPEIVNRAT